MNNIKYNQHPPVTKNNSSKSINALRRNQIKNNDEDMFNKENENNSILKSGNNKDGENNENDDENNNKLNQNGLNTKSQAEENDSDDNKNDSDFELNNSSSTSSLNNIVNRYKNGKDKLNKQTEDYYKKIHDRIRRNRPKTILESFDDSSSDDNSPKKTIAYDDAVLLFKKYGHDTTEILLKSFQAALGITGEEGFTRDGVELFSDIVAYFAQKFGLKKLGKKEFEKLIEDIKYWSLLFEVYDIRKCNLIYLEDMRETYNISDEYLIILFPSFQETITKIEFFQHIGFYLELHNDVLEQLLRDRIEFRKNDITDNQ